jgi:hypothetical protein
MTDVNTEFVRTWAQLIADDVERLTERQDVSETEAFYDSLADRGVIAVFRDRSFCSDLNQVMAGEWDVDRDNDEVAMLRELMEEHGLDDLQTRGQAASALSRLRRVVLANTTAS